VRAARGAGGHDGGGCRRLGAGLVLPLGAARRDVGLHIYCNPVAFANSTVMCQIMARLRPEVKCNRRPPHAKVHSLQPRRGRTTKLVYARTTKVKHWVARHLRPSELATFVVSTHATDLSRSGHCRVSCRLRRWLSGIAAVPKKYWPCAYTKLHELRESSVWCGVW
jgi:hypothetical protein